MYINTKIHVKIAATVHITVNHVRDRISNKQLFREKKLHLSPHSLPVRCRLDGVFQRDSLEKYVHLCVITDNIGLKKFYVHIVYFLYFM